MSSEQKRKEAMQKLRIAEFERDQAIAEVARLEGLILDWADAIPGATSTRYVGERVARSDAALEIEARRIRAQREEGGCFACQGSGRMPDTQDVATGAIRPHACRACGGSGKGRP